MVQRIGNNELEILLQLLERLEPTFICEEMMEDKKEEQVCANYCEYTAPVAECFIRYAKMKKGETNE